MKKPVSKFAFQMQPAALQCGKYGLDAKGVYGGRERLKMPTSDGGGRGPFMFHAQLNMGPFIFRRDALRHMGGPQLGFSCRGESGIGGAPVQV
jgi:hypothetical protein